MRIGILGTGVVGRTLGSALVDAGHEVRLGSRSADTPAARDWAAASGSAASHGTFADAAAFGELLFNCTAGAVSLQALEAAGRENVEGKVLIDVANPLDFSKGMPPSLTVCNTDSLGEQIQRAFPGARVVKTLNTVNCNVMVDPARVPGEHVLYVCGDDDAAKDRVVRGLEQWFGWPHASIVDLGDITAARAMEMVLPMWVRVMLRLGTADFNFSIQRAPAQVAIQPDPGATVH